MSPLGIHEMTINSLRRSGVVQDIKKEAWVLTDEGKTYAATGSPEVQLFLAIPPEGIPKDELQVITEIFL